MNDVQLIDKLTQAITYRFRDDKTSPGLVVSALKKGYYCSVVRYSEAFAKGKVVVCKAKADSLTTALTSLAGRFLDMTPVPMDPIQELRSAVGSK